MYTDTHTHIYPHTHTHTHTHIGEGGERERERERESENERDIEPLYITETKKQRPNTGARANNISPPCVLFIFLLLGSPWLFLKSLVRIPLQGSPV